MKKVLIFLSIILLATLGKLETTNAAWTYYNFSVNYIVDAGTPDAISVSLDASPNSMTLPTNSTTLSWSTTGSPTSCVASNAWSGSKNASGGSQNITGLTAGNYLFEITCSKSGVADASASALVVVESAPAPVGTLTANDCTIALGASSCSSSVAWTTANLTASSTAITRDIGSPSSFTPSPLSSGSQSVTLSYGTTNFYLYHNSALLAQDPAVASCASGSWNGSVCQADSPSVSLVASPSALFSGSSSTLSWTSSNVDTCTASASPISSSWVGSRGRNSSYPHESTGALYTTTTFTLSCTGTSGNASDSKTVTVLPNTGSDVAANLTADPERIASGESSTLSWTSANATSCSGIGFSTGGDTSGSTSVSPTVNTTYTVSCTDGSSSASDQATVYLKRKFLFIEF